MDDTPMAPPIPPDARPLSTATTEVSGVANVGIGYLPAPGHTARVGGDWVDVVEPTSARPDAPTAFVIGDVMGHGPHLAGRSHVAGTVLARALRDHGPAAALHQLDVSWSAVPAWADAMATACVVTATAFTTPAPVTRGHRLPALAATTAGAPGRGWLLRWSNAGHPPPLLLTPAGTATLLTHHEADLPIGVDHTRRRHESTCVVPDGSTLLMFTDGVVEHRDPAAVDGVAHLATLTTELSPAGRYDPVGAARRLLTARAPHLDTGDESTLLVAHLDTHAARRDVRLGAAA